MIRLPVCRIRAKVRVVTRLRSAGGSVGLGGDSDGVCTDAVAAVGNVWGEVIVKVGLRRSHLQKTEAKTAVALRQPAIVSLF